MPIRQINSPGVEIREIDKSQVAPAIVGTNCLVMGYSQKGEAYNPLDIVSISDFETNFGTPTNEAERYFYYAAKDVIQEGGNLIAARLPYQASDSSSNSYKVLPFTLTKDTTNSTLLSSELSDPTLSAFTSYSFLASSSVDLPTQRLYDSVYIKDFYASDSTEYTTIMADDELSGATITLSDSLKFTNIAEDLSGAIDTLNGFASVSAYTKLELSDVTNITTSAYDTLKSAGTFTSALSANDFVIVNENTQEKSGPKANEGVFVSVVSPFQGALVQRIISSEGTDPMVVINDMKDDTTSSFQKALSGTYDDVSISEDLMNYFPSIEFTNSGDDLDSYYFDHIAVVVAKTVADPNNNGVLTVQYLESFVGSVNEDARDPSTGEQTFIGNVINDSSNYIKIYKNSNSSTTLNRGSIIVSNTELNDKLDLMAFNELTASEKLIDGDTLIIDTKTVFEKVSNIDERQIDVVVDAGLSTISQYCTTEGIIPSGIVYDPKNGLPSGNGDITTSNNTSVWREFCSEMIDFCQNTRKDCMTVLDVTRALGLERNEKRIRKTAPDSTFSNQIGPKLKYFTGLNSSYAALYVDWMKQFDVFSGTNFWMPPTCKVAGIYCRNDRIGNIWDAPAGLTRGIVDSINDIAFNPTQKESDQIYPKGMNYCKHYPTDGFVLEGQKTTQAKPSAFDRVNVRRLFLRLERLVYQVSRYFVHEPNNTFTRRRLVSTISPIFETVKAEGGLYDFLIVCDESNNTPEVIDRNELKVAIMLKPVRTAEYITVDFIAARTDANFSELL